MTAEEFLMGVMFASSSAIVLIMIESLKVNKK